MEVLVIVFFGEGRSSLSPLFGIYRCAAIVQCRLFEGDGAALAPSSQRLGCNHVATIFQQGNVLL